jgi:hypothetical protein
MLFKGVEGVVGAGGEVATGGGATARCRLIEAHPAMEQPRDRVHDRSASREMRSSTSTASSCWGASITSGCTERRYAPEPRRPSRARSSNRARRRRRQRFRRTAEPARRGMAKATSIESAAVGRYTTESPRRRTRRPSARRLANVARRRMPRITPTGVRGPSGDVIAERPGRPWSTYACGSRASWPACERSADKCASSMTPPGTAPDDGSAAAERTGPALPPASVANRAAYVDNGPDVR